jgi:2-isopropylmalate synthase
LEFAALVQGCADQQGGEIAPDRIVELFTAEYISRPLMSVPMLPRAAVPVVLYVDGAEFEVGAARADAVERIKRALATWRIDLRAVHRTGTGLAGCADSAVYAELRIADKPLWGVGVDPDPETAILAAVRSAAARLGRIGEQSPSPSGRRYIGRYARAG